MSCDRASGRTEPCKKSVGGLRKAFFMNWQKDALTVVGGQVTGIAVSVTEVFGWELRADENNLSEALVSSRNDGTTVNTQTLTLRFKKQDYQTSNEIAIMAQGRPIIIVEYHDGAYKAVGHKDGNDLTGSNIQSGGAKSSFNGYDLTFTAEEEILAPELDSATVAALLALESATVIGPTP